MNTKKEQIKKHLQAGKSLTQMGAIKLFSAYRLASTIHRLRDEGMNIKSDKITRGNVQFSRYYLV